ncbi:hypothetical protein H8356DRAFT_1435207 [Neocallimastix lanati (nom. inval.)]|nr:hypothetical protein H8356DRAFT_1435207 [Neocallimastix sp. JGI-2020a]
MINCHTSTAKETPYRSTLRDPRAPLPSQTVLYYMGFLSPRNRKNTYYDERITTLFMRKNTPWENENLVMASNLFLKRIRLSLNSSPYYFDMDHLSKQGLI